MPRSSHSQPCLAAVLLSMTVVMGKETHGADTRFSKLEPLLKQYCVRCHGGEETKGDVDLSGPITQIRMLQEQDVWMRVIEQIESEEMPPKKPFPTSEETASIIALVDQGINHVDWSQFHHPGHLSLARLTTVEYRNAMREIFGVDLKAGVYLGKDPEGNTGFTNDRDSLNFPLFAFDDFMREAERAVDAFLSYGRKPWVQKIEMEVAWQNVSDKSTSLTDDGTGVILGEPNSPFQLNLDLPFPGLYQIDLTASLFGGEPLSGMKVVVNGRTVDRIILEGMESRTYSTTVNLGAGANVVSLGFDPKIAPIVQRKFEPRLVPAEFEKQVRKPAVKAFAMPAKFDGNKEARQAWDRMNKVIQVFTLTQRLAEFLLAQGTHDYELNSLANGTAASTASNFSSNRVSLNLSAGKVAVYMGIPQPQLEKQIQRETGFSFEAYARAVGRYTSALRNKYPERVEKKASKIVLDRAVIRSHALTAADESPAWAFGEETESSAASLLQRLSRRAYGRDARPAERDRLMAIYRQTREEVGSHEEALRDALVGLLVSPPFLLHYSGPAGKTAVAVDDHDLARRLARFLWLGLPDEALRAAADAGKLHNPEVLAASVERMIDSPKFDAVVQLFIDQWLNLESLATLEDSPKIDASSVLAMREEPALLLRHVIRENRSLLDLVNADYTFLNASLARHYDIDGVASHDMQRVALTDARRGGLLAMGGMQTVTSTPERTSPVARGAWVVELFLGEHLPAAPASVPELKTDNKARTVREELELHRSVKECAGCHRRIDPFGFVLENYDQFGAWREKERGKAVNASTQLPDGTSVNGLAEFRDYVMNQRRDDFVRNVASRMLEFALGRQLTFSDEATVQSLLKTVSADNYRARTLIRAITQSSPFLQQNDETAER